MAGLRAWTAGCTSYSCGGARRLFYGRGRLLSRRLPQPAGGGGGRRREAGVLGVASDGGIFSYGEAKFYGSTGANLPESADGGHGAHLRRRGVLVVASDGGIFTFGDAVLRLDGGLS